MRLKIDTGSNNNFLIINMWLSRLYEGGETKYVTCNLNVLKFPFKNIK